MKALLLAAIAVLSVSQAHAAPNQSAVDKMLRMAPFAQINCDGLGQVVIRRNQASVNGRSYGWMTHPVSANLSDGFTLTLQNSRGSSGAFACFLIRGELVGSIRTTTGNRSLNERASAGERTVPPGAIRTIVRRR